MILSLHKFLGSLPTPIAWLPYALFPAALFAVIVVVLNLLHMFLPYSFGAWLSAIGAGAYLVVLLYLPAVVIPEKHDPSRKLSLLTYVFTIPLAIGMLWLAGV